MRITKKLWLLLPLIVCGTLVLSSCDSVDFGDINEDDDAVSDANVEGLMAGAMNRFFALGGRTYQIRPLLYVQYMTQVTYTDEQRYGESPQSWTGYYVQTLSNLKRVREITTADEVGAQVKSYGAPVNQAAVAELMSVFIWKRITNTYGPVPYMNALNDTSATLTVPYTEQETIYKDLIDRAQAARDMLNPDVDNPVGPAGPTGDVAYGGDVSKWQKFANSLLMTLSMQLTKKYPDAGGYAATVFNEALNDEAGMIDDVSEGLWYDYTNSPGAENPFTSRRPADYQISEPFVSALKGNADEGLDADQDVENGRDVIGYSSDTTDARISVYSSDSSLAGRPYGYDTLPTRFAGSYANVAGVIFTNPETPLPYMTAAYTYLNRAEAAERGWTDEDAEEMLTEGITHSYAAVDKYFDDGSMGSGALQSDGSDFAESRLEDADSASGGLLQVIGEEKWAALFPQGFQAWSEWRRTGYPELMPAPDATNGGEIPRRYLYPSEEPGVNAGNYEAGVDLLTPATDNSLSRFWWDIE